MTGVLRQFLSVIFSIDLKVLSLRYDLKTCQTKCREENGHLPYLYQALDRTTVYILGVVASVSIITRVK